MQKTVFRVTLSILLLLCGCGKLFLNIDENYPRTISPLPSDDLRKHKDEYRAQNNFWPWRGSFGQQYTFVVTEESIGLTTRKVILPLNRNQNIELRVAWEIPISDGLWNVYVDTTTGEKLRVDQLFDT